MLPSVSNFDSGFYESYSTVLADVLVMVRCTRQSNSLHDFCVQHVRRIELQLSFVQSPLNSISSVAVTPFNDIDSLNNVVKKSSPYRNWSIRIV